MISWNLEKNMQLTFKRIYTVFLTAIILLVNTSAFAAPAKKTYSENEFLGVFSGKSKTVVIDKLGQPFKKAQSVKPSGANAMLLRAGADEKKSKPVKVEMWYYKNIVKYDAKRTYKETEITLVNDRVQNIAFFNNR
jgi:hypothetical protein